MFALVCPGQGAQKPGFLAPWLEVPGTEELLGELGEAGGIDLIAHGTTSDAEAITATDVAQPLLVAAGIAVSRALFGSVDAGAASLVAGHSVGEVTATALTGVLSPTDAMRLVRMRAGAMARAAAATPTSMAAVVGGDRQEILDLLGTLDLTPANINSSTQVVAAGTPDALAQLAENPPRRARVIPLSVAGAFHTAHMEPAREELAAGVSEFSPADPSVPLVSNRDGKPVISGTAYLERIVTQVASPVDWQACMGTFRDQGVQALVEVAPAGTLVGLAKRELKPILTLALNTPDDLDAARRLVREHGAARPDSGARPDAGAAGAVDRSV